MDFNSSIFTIRIIGEEEVDPDKHKCSYVVSVMTPTTDGTKKWKTFYGDALISRYIVLTVADCIYLNEETTPIITKMIVRTGSIKINKRKPYPILYISTLNYNLTTNSNLAYIAILTVNR